MVKRYGCNSEKVSFKNIILKAGIKEKLNRKPDSGSSIKALPCADSISRWR